MKLYDPIRFDVYVSPWKYKDNEKNKKRKTDESYVYTIFIQPFEEKELNEVIRKLKFYNKSHMVLRLDGKENLSFSFSYEGMYVQIEDYVYEFNTIIINRDYKRIKFSGRKGNLVFNYFIPSELVKLQGIEFDVI